MVSILKRSLTSFRLMVLKTSACIDASEARSKAKLSTDICKSYDNNIRFIEEDGVSVATVTKSDDGGTCCWGVVVLMMSRRLQMANYDAAAPPP